MSDLNPIIILEDDIDDHEIFTEALNALGVKNELIIFTDATKALDFLLVTPKQPFLILSDINLPGMNGLTFRSVIQQNEYLKSKSIPFIFFTTGTSKQQVKAAYDLTVQGFFIKPSSFIELQSRLKAIVDYWSSCLHPNAF
jgi:CheY-like chemotaxis protein